ncbi:DUF6517 family protein [Haloarcula sp. S1AR25-5A]|uniref:DUF6517 family protein n=1 Tax=Haloarcula terrestris TaxID=2950533 RepID=A0AAE4ETX4_9EURY|nr:DUF6517 family protein [Haloarcula terrestris]MDS0219927.1 DUF6517 family protein [Haloarcula terrestris]
MSHGVGPLFLTAAKSNNVVYPPDTTRRERPDSPNLGLGLSNKTDGDTTVGSTTIDTETIPSLPTLSKIYWNHLDEDWAADTQMTVAVFTTPSASVGGQSLNPLDEVDEEGFVTADGGKYLEESGIREAAGLGKNLSWTVPPAEVASRSVTFLGSQTTMRTYVGYAKTADSAIPRTLLINFAKTTTGDDIAFGVTVQYRAMFSMNEDGRLPTDGILSAMSVPDLVGTEANNGLSVSAGDDITLILEDGVAASADLASQAIGDLSLA